MAKSFISKRITFSNNATKDNFLNDCKKKGVTANLLASYMNVSDRMARDWLRGKYSMPEKALLYIIDNFNVALPSCHVVTREEHLQNISAQGGRARYKKYGVVACDEKKRKQSWEKWWQEKGRHDGYAHITKPKHVSLPLKSRDLAEFVGIMMGDGGVTKYFISITLSSERDREYAQIVSTFLKRLFGVEPKLYKRKKQYAIDIVIHRTLLTDFCVSIGLRKGNKLAQGLVIPQWIRCNKTYTKACIRGLFDTDGSLFMHTYDSKKRTYSYPKLSFSSASPVLVQEVCTILRDLQVNARITRNRKEVRIENISDVEKYFSVVGSSNPKFQNKLEECQSGLMERIANP